MRAVRRLVLTVVGVAVLVVGLTPHAQAGDELWITIERVTAERAREVFESRGRADLISFEGDAEVVVGRVREDDLAALSEWLHEDRKHCGGFMGHTSREAAVKEALRANREGDLSPATALIDYTIDNGPVVQALMAGMTAANIQSTITSLSTGFKTRYHNCTSGRNSANWIRNLWLGYAGTRTDVTVQLFRHTGFTTKQPSVILTINGTTLPTEVVVLGAHQDSIVSGGNNCTTSRAPGADDDASGVASLSEVIRMAMATGYKPLRTVKFMAYAAEEVGLLGSNQIATQFKQQGVNVVGVLQLDMTNFKGGSQDIYMIGDNTNAAQNAFVEQLIDTYLTGITRGTTVCQYGCSDHASWNAQGFATSFPFEAYFRPNPPPQNYNPFIHTINDTLAQSGNNANHALKFAKLSAAYLAELAKGQ